MMIGKSLEYIHMKWKANKWARYIYCSAFDKAMKGEIPNVMLPEWYTTDSLLDQMTETIARDRHKFLLPY